MITPGMGYLARKFLKEGRTVREFYDAQATWQACYREYKDRWPTDEQGYVAYIDDLFGVREKAGKEILNTLANVG